MSLFGPQTQQRRSFHCFHFELFQVPVSKVVVVVQGVLGSRIWRKSSSWKWCRWPCSGTGYHSNIGGYYDITAEVLPWWMPCTAAWKLRTHVRGRMFNNAFISFWNYPTSQTIELLRETLRMRVHRSFWFYSVADVKNIYPLILNSWCGVSLG